MSWLARIFGRRPAPEPRGMRGTPFPRDYSWRCDFCGELRPDAQISVRFVDITPPDYWPAGTVTRNLKYCNDRFACWLGAKTWQPEKKTGGA